MRRWLHRLLVVLAIGFAAPAQAEKRVALVIGNSAYKYAPALANPKNDAEGMAASLKRLGFEVLAGTDLDKPAMDRLMQAFADKIEKADVALVFYAGHGLQVHGRNYLVPVDGKLDKESDLVFQAVALDTLQGLMEQGPRTSIMILDACRDNPLARNLARTMGTRSTSIGRGLGAAQAGVGTLIVYATQPGNVALDGDVGANSPFTAALLTHLETKGLEVRQVLTRVRQAVIEKTRGKQVPWDSSSLTGDFFFVVASREALPAETKPPPATPPASTETSRGPSADSENLFWQSIKDSKNAADFKAYLEKYPAGTFAALAKIRLAEIEKAAVTPPAPSAPEKPAPPPAPATPRRTSTFQPGLVVVGANLKTVGPVANASVCQALCLQQAQCAAWAFVSPAATAKAYARYCTLLRTVERSWQSPEKGDVGGIIRTASEPGPAPRPETPKPQPGAVPATPAASTPQALIRELMRKAQAGEAEQGICARVSSPHAITFTLQAVAKAAPGSPAFYKKATGCGVVVVHQVTTAAGRICKQFTDYLCLTTSGRCWIWLSQKVACGDNTKTIWDLQ